jgi:hypothetical protein
MTAGPILSDRSTGAKKRRQKIFAVAVALCVAVALAMLFVRADAPRIGATIGERLLALRAERATLQARADGEARISLLQAFRTAGLLTDALAARYESDAERAFDGLPAARCQSAFKRDPGSASKRDPPEGRVLTSAHPPSELFGRLTIRAAAGSVGM